MTTNTTKPAPPGEIQELQRLSELATPGPWIYRYKSNSWHKPPQEGTAYRYGESIMDPDDDWSSMKGEDIEFVQALVNWFRSNQAALNARVGGDWLLIENAAKDVDVTIIMGFAPDEENYSPDSREGYWSDETNGWRLTSDPSWSSNPQPTHWQPLPAPPAALKSQKGVGDSNG